MAEERRPLIRLQLVVVDVATEASKLRALLRHSEDVALLMTLAGELQQLIASAHNTPPPPDVFDAIARIADEACAVAMRIRTSTSGGPSAHAVAFDAAARAAAVLTTVREILADSEPPASSG